MSNNSWHKPAPDIFSDTKGHYRHNVQTVPAYVLNKLGKAHLREQRTSDPNSSKSGHPDVFVQTLNNDWSNFLHTVEASPAYSYGVVHHDQIPGGVEPDLETAWGGGERLMQEFGRDPKSLSDEKSKGKLKRSRSDNSPKVRSKAGYWMSDEKRADWKPTLRRVFLDDPYIPLTLRLGIFILSVAALALAVQVFQKSNHHRYNEGSGVAQQPSTIMAICVQSCAIVYLFYITYDEFSGKPLGLRNPAGKMRLIMLDLLFIIFSSSNLSLTFNSLYDMTWVCEAGENTVNGGERFIGTICDRQRALAAFLFVILVMWLLNFTISILRVMERFTPQNT